MTAKVHRILTVTAATIAGIGGLVVVTDPASLGVSAGTWEIVGGWCAFIGGIASLVVTSVRQLAEPA